jgi:hypothetical protein
MKYGEIRIRLFVPGDWTEKQLEAFMARYDRFDSAVAAHARGFFGDDSGVTVEVE